MQLQQNQLFASHYRLERLLGRGGFSEVWLAHDETADVRVAVKVYAPGTGLDDDGADLFRKEFKIVFDMNHTNLLCPKHFDVVDNMPYLVMPYVERGSTTKMIGRMPEAEVWRFVRDVASGLAYLHAKKPPVIHQDIKPDNVMVMDDGTYVITDFGISTRARSTLRKSVNTNASPGTMAYMGPERFSKENAPIKASDVWSLGATVYELMEGDVPFGRFGGTMQKSGAEVPNIHGAYSEELKELVYDCLSQETWDRPTAEQLSKYCTKHIDGEYADKPWKRGGGQQGGGRETQPHPQPKPQRNLTWLWVLLAVAVLGGVAFGVKSNMERKRLAEQQRLAEERQAVADNEFFQNCKDVSDYRSYLNKYPKGLNAELAKNKIDRHVADSTKAQEAKRQRQIAAENERKAQEAERQRQIADTNERTEAGGAPTPQRVATGTIVLESNPSGAVITIDGRQYGQTPKTLTEFPVGTYTVYFTKEGYQNLAQNIDLKDGGRETLSVTMSKTSAPPQQVVQQQPVQQQPALQQPVQQQPAPTGTVSGQNTSPINVISFNLVPNGIMDEGKLQKNQREDFNGNPVCLVRVKAQGFDESVLENLNISPRGSIRFMHKLFRDGMWYLYVSSKLNGSIVIRYKGECVYKLPYPLEPKKIYELVLGMQPVSAETTVSAGNKINGHEYVDLGLPSGTLWATCNVGADSPEDYGNYYAWGETTTKSTYNWSTYKWCRGDSDSQTKYNMKSAYGIVDNKTILEMSDDAARANWGGDWRMPTKEEWIELKYKCTWTWTTQGGKNGYRVTGPNGKSIFLPDAGFRNGTVVNSAGSYGSYWSSSLYSSNPGNAYYVSFSPGGVNPYNYYYRYFGYTVRPVR